MIVGVSGGRTYDRWQVIHPVLDKFHHRYGITGLIQGEAKGADFCAKTWAYNNRVQLIGPEGTSDVGFKADWETYGRSAGYKRNREMAKAGPDLFLIFQGGVGTTQMRQLAIEYEIPTLVIPDLEWARQQDPDEADVVITFDDPDEPPPYKPYWAFKPKPNQQWKVIDHEAIAQRQRELAESAERYKHEALF